MTKHGILFSLLLGAALVCNPHRLLAQDTARPEPPLEHKYFQLQLTGQNVVSGGNPNGRAKGTLSIDTGSYRIVWGLTFSGIGSPTSVELHQGVEGTTGPKLISLGPGTLIGGSANTLSGSLDAPLEIDRRLREQILASPADYYLQISTRDYPEGALRAQLTSPTEGE